ncbi:hypothetical protein ACSTK3_23550, partial [Vibrio parahaemolyticus]
MTSQAIKSLYHYDLRENEVLINATKPEFEGDYTIVLFSLLKPLKKSPDTLGNELGNFITQQHTNL